MTSQEILPDIIDRLGAAVYPSFAMLAGMQLDLFTSLKDGPLDTEQIAEALGVQPDKLSRLLYALVAAELLVPEGDLYKNTAEADRYLVRGKPTFLGGRHQSITRRWDNVLKTAETIRTGVPQGRRDYGSLSPEQNEALARSGESDTSAAAEDLLERFDFSRFQTLLDVGGGAGYLSIRMTEAFRDLKATVVDLPAVTTVTNMVVSENGAENQVNVMTTDVVNEIPEGSFDVVVMRNFVQVLSANQARSALLNVGEAIKPGGEIYILGQILDDTRITPLEVVGFNLFFLNTFDDGQAYTEKQHRDWLTEAGLDFVERLVVQESRSIVRARKPMRV